MAGPRITSADVRLHPTPLGLHDDDLLYTTFREVLAGAVTLLGTGKGILALRDSGSDDLWTTASVGFDDAYVQATARIPGGQGACGTALVRGEPVVVEDTALDPLFEPFRGAAAQGGYAAMASHPLVDSTGRVMGTLSAHFPCRHRPTPREVEQVSQYARIAALALENARLRQEAAAESEERERLYEAERVARQAAEQANAVKSEFLGVVSHELRTPLNAIVGYTELLLGQVRGALTEAQMTQVERVKSSAGHLVEIIDDILDYASLDAGKEQVRIEDVDVCALVAETLVMVGPTAAAKGLELHAELPDQAVTVVTDARKLRQVVLNLLSNATKFTESGHIRVHLVPAADGIVIEVEDTGRGIAPDQLEAIFEPFVRGPQEDAPRVAGTGLGLSISRGLARLFGGDLSVTSTVGVGSTFRLHLPHRG
jgi:signal transduction histidine kinase